MALVRDLWLPNSLDTMTGPIWPSIDAENFELRPGLIALVQQSQFRGLPSEDPQEHIRNVLEYASTVQYNGVSRDAVKCMLFTFSLRDGAKEWYYSLPSRSYTWSEISHAFLHRYFPLYKQAAIRDQIISFAQDGSESLYAAWERYRHMLRRCPNHGLKDWFVLQIFYRGLTCASRDLIDMSAGGSIMNKTVEGAVILIESIAFHQMQWGYEKLSSNEEVTGCQQLEAVSSIHEQKSCVASTIQNYQIPFNGQQQFRTNPDPPLSKNELTSAIFDDYDNVQDDSVIVDRIDDTTADTRPNADTIVIDESKLQEAVEEEPTLFDADLRKQDMEKFTCVTQLTDWWNLAVSPIVRTYATAASKLFERKKSSIPLVASACIIDEEDAPEEYSEAEIHATQPDHTSECQQMEAIEVYSEDVDSGVATEDQERELESPTIEEVICLDSPTCSPNFEILSIDEDRATSDVNEDEIFTELSSTLLDIILQDVATSLHSTLPPLDIEVRYDSPVLGKPYPTNRIADNITMETCNSRNMVYAYKVSCCMNDLEGVCPITCIFCFFERIFRITLVFCPLEWNKDRVDIPWDPGGFKEW